MICKLIGDDDRIIPVIILHDFRFLIHCFVVPDNDPFFVFCLLRLLLAAGSEGKEQCQNQNDRKNLLHCFLLPFFSNDLLFFQVQVTEHRAVQNKMLRQTPWQFRVNKAMMDTV